MLNLGGVECFPMEVRIVGVAMEIKGSAVWSLSKPMLGLYWSLLKVTSHWGVVDPPSAHEENYVVPVYLVLMVLLLYWCRRQSDVELSVFENRQKTRIPGATK